MFQVISKIESNLEMKYEYDLDEKLDYICSNFKTRKTNRSKVNKEKCHAKGFLKRIRFRKEKLKIV